MDVHIVRDKVSKRVKKIIKIVSEKQRADISTKAPTSTQHNFLCSELGLFNLFQI